MPSRGWIVRLPNAQIYVLDTNIFLAYVRQSELFRRIEGKYSLTLTLPVPIYSVVTEGEIRALAEENNWGTRKRQDMEDFLAYFQRIPLPHLNVIEKYVAISEHSRQQGRTMGKNDLWIAATVAVTKSTLLTTDKDFDHLHPVFLTRDWIDPTI